MPRVLGCGGSNECEIRKGQKQSNGAGKALNWMSGNLSLCLAGSCMASDKLFKLVLLKPKHESESSGGLLKMQIAGHYPSSFRFPMCRVGPENSYCQTLTRRG